MDTLRQAVAKVIEAAGQRIHKIQWPGFTGLPTSLAAEPGAIVLATDLTPGLMTVAFVGSVRVADHPGMLNFYGQLFDGVDYVEGNAPQSVYETVRMLEPAWTVVAIEAACAVWAIHRRALDVATLGDGLKPVVERILPVLPIGTEGQKVFDLGEIVGMLKAEFGVTGSLA